MMNKVVLRGTTGLVMISLLALGACDRTTGQTVGAVVGTVGGVLLGSQFGKGTGQLVAAGIGAAAGYMIGDWVGQMLDPKDAQAVQNTTSKALEQQPDGQAVVWTNPDSGAKAEIVPTNTHNATKQVKVKRPKVVASPVGMTIVGEKREVTKGANVRAAPSTSADILTGLKAGTRVTAVGSVSNGDWYLVGSGDKAIGYVYHTLLGPVEPEVQTADAVTTQTTTTETTTTTQTTTTKTSSKVVADDTDAATKASDAKPSPDATATASADNGATTGEDAGVVDLDADYETDTLVVQTKCRDISMKVSNGSDTEEKNYSACKTPDGVWELG
jgi:surface antigen